MTDDNLMLTMQPDDIRRMLAFDAEQDAMAEQSRRDAERAHQAAVEGAAIEAANAASAAIVAEFQAAEPPELPAVQTNGLPAQRARLVRFVAWLESLEAELKSLNEGRETYLSTQGIPALTQAKIDALIREDRDGLISMMAAGGGGISKYQTRAREHKLLAEKLNRDEYASSIAVEALAEVEKRIDAIEHQILTLRARHKTFVADALAEAVAASAGSKLIAKMDALHDGALTVMGAQQALQTLRGVSVLPRRHEVVLPTPRVSTDRWHSATEAGPGYYTDSGSGYTIAFEVHQQEAMQRKWMDKAKALLADPHAQIED